ncbi:MAG: DUF3363 domain-containing protein [Treponema sp.]|jgi:hypothetical protein|nr:DUF3363 domain-containing protein [Treponema sp.]
MRHFLFEEKEYRIRASFKRRREPDAMRELARLMRGGRSSGGRSADLRQNCVSKMNYSGSFEAHRVQLENYLSREGTDIDGNAAALFGTETEEYRNNMTAKNFRIFLSPQSPGINLRSLAEKFIENLEKQTGYRFFWQGAGHYNTAHPHAHVLINGVDRAGREITIPRDIVKTFMRETARDLCTAQLGKRTEKDLAVEREKQLSTPRFTALDKRIKELCAGTSRVTLHGGIYEKDRISARMEALRKLKLCRYEGGGYRLKTNWDEDLKANGRYSAFLKSREHLNYSNPSSLKVYSGAAGEITGKVTKIYRTDGDASDNHAVVLEGLDGGAYFVPLFKKPEITAQSKAGEGKAPGESLAEGDFVTLKIYRTQTGRLTPFIFKKEPRHLQSMVRRNAWSGKLAREVLGGKTRNI